MRNLKQVRVLLLLLMLPLLHLLVILLLLQGVHGKEEWKAGDHGRDAKDAARVDHLVLCS